MARSSKRPKPQSLTNQESTTMSDTIDNTQVNETQVTSTPVVEETTILTPVEQEEPVVPFDGLLNTVTSVLDTPKVVEPPKETTPVVNNSSKYLDMADTYRTSGTPAEKGFFETLDRFIRVMRRSHFMKEDVAIMEQVQFFQALEYIINTTPPTLFRKFWSSVLATCAANMGDNDVFTAPNCLRHIHKWSLGPVRLDKYISLLNLIIFTAKPEDRAGLSKRMSIRKLIEQDFSQQGRQNIQTFYGG